MKEVYYTATTTTYTIISPDMDNLDFSFPLFDKLYIPSKIKSKLIRDIPSIEFKKIHNNKKIAIDAILLIVAQLTITIKNDNYPDGWKSLKAEILKTMLQPVNYVDVINFLVKHNIIEVNKFYHIGTRTRKYRLTDNYNKGVKIHTLLSKSIIKSKRNTYNQYLALATTNPIALNSLRVQANVTLPTVDELLKKGKELVKEGYITNKGKKLTMRNKNNNEHWVDYKERSFVEDNIVRFSMLTELGYMIPIVGNDKSGGRVVDSFTLMPSWIRKECLINGNKMIEKDYTTLHPNITSMLYGGPSDMITHDIVSEHLGIDRREAKIEHLSFFNKTYGQMMKSPLWAYYSSEYPDMLGRVVKEKADSKFEHRITSMKLFKVEVDIMSKVISQLNKQGINVIYVYDALYCESSVAPFVGKLMNMIANEYNVNTTTDTLTNKKESKMENIEEVEKLELELYNRTIVTIYGERLKYWNSIKDKPALMKRLLKNSTQNILNMIIDNKISESKKIN